MMDSESVAEVLLKNSQQGLHMIFRKRAEAAASAYEAQETQETVLIIDILIYKSLFFKL